MFGKMNAGGTPFWLALVLSGLLALGATGWFLSGASSGEEGKPATMGSLEDRPAAETASSTSEEVETGAGPQPLGATGAEDHASADADVTFSFAEEVVRFEDGSTLEQDDLFRVTHRSPEGDALWALGMEGRLIGVHRVDANGDGQDEFLLLDSLHARGLDPEGRPIPGFSIRPSSPITSHAVVDYDGDGKERYLIGLADGRVLNHRRLGEATPGWRHTSKGSAVQAIAHLRAGRKDFICTVDEKGVVMLLKRNGQRRLRTPSQLNAVAGKRSVAFQVQSDIAESLLISRSAEGKVEARPFGSGIARPASRSEEQLLEVEEARTVVRD